MTMGYGDQILIGYDAYGEPIYVPGLASFGGRTGSAPSGGQATPQYDTAPPEYEEPIVTGVEGAGSTLQQVDQALQQNRALREKTAESGWYKLDPSDPVGKWEQDPAVVRALADLDAKYTSLLAQRRLAETADAKGPAAASGTRWTNPQDGSEWLLDPRTGEPIRQLSGPIPGYIPGRGVPTPQQPPQRAPRYPEEIEKAQLDIQKLQRDLQDPFTQKFQQEATALQMIEQQLARREISEQDAAKTMGLIRANTDAVLRGTTPWQMETAKRNEETALRTQRQNLAQDLLSDQFRTGSSLATGLLSGMGNIYGGIYSSTNPPLDFNPMTEALNFSKAVYGPELSEMAKALLSGALQPPAQPQQPQQPMQGGF